MYVRTYYPKVATVHTLPLGATEALYRGEKEPDCRILFTGTYEDPDRVYALVKEARPDLRESMERLIERRVSEPLIPMEQCARRICSTRKGQSSSRSSLRCV